MRKLNERDYEVMGLPAKFYESSWGSLQINNIAQHFERYIRNIKTARIEGVGLFIGGVPSSGKSYAASFVAKVYRQLGQSVQWLEAVEGYNLLVWGKEHSDPEYGTWLNRVQTVDILVLDNFGAEKGTNKQKILLEVCRKRSESKLPTIITTRFNLKELSEVYDESVDFFRDIMKSVALTKSIKPVRSHIEKY